MFFSPYIVAPSASCCSSYPGLMWRSTNDVEQHCLQGDQAWLACRSSSGSPTTPCKELGAARRSSLASLTLPPSRGTGNATLGPRKPPVDTKSNSAIRSQAQQRHMIFLLERFRRGDGADVRYPNVWLFKSVASQHLAAVAASSAARKIVQSRTFP